MSTVGITFANAMDASASVYSAGHIASESVASSASSAQSTIAASGAPGEVCRVTATGGAVWVCSGSSNPTAVVGRGFYIPDGGTIDLGRFQTGWKLAVIDA